MLERFYEIHVRGKLCEFAGEERMYGPFFRYPVFGLKPKTSRSRRFTIYFVGFFGSADVSRPSSERTFAVDRCSDLSR